MGAIDYQNRSLEYTLYSDEYVENKYMTTSFSSSYLWVLKKV